MSTAIRALASPEALFKPGMIGPSTLRREGRFGFERKGSC